MNPRRVSGGGFLLGRHDGVVMGYTLLDGGGLMLAPQARAWGS